MAQYSHLNIYKTTLDLLVQITVLIGKFDRNYRHTLGEKLQNSTVDFIVLIYKANSSTNKNKRIFYINKMLEQLQHINIYLRLSCEVKNFSKEKYIELAKITQDIERQLTGWLTYSLKSTRINEEE